MVSEIALTIGYLTITSYFLFLAFLLKKKKLLFYGALLFSAVSIAGLSLSLTIISNDNATLQSLFSPFKDFLVSAVSMASFLYLVFLFWYVLRGMFQFVKSTLKKFRR